MMNKPRTFLLFDRRVQPSSWNERMVPGEYAVLYSNLRGMPTGTEPACDVFSTLKDAEIYARQRVSDDPTLQCRIYDHHGLAGQPVSEIKGSEYKGESEITSRFRRWVGSALFFGGIGLILVDWIADFRFTWPATLGVRMAPVGLVLLVTEIAILLSARQKTSTNAGGHRDTHTPAG
jgi:hypothetical protein